MNRIGKLVGLVGLALVAGCAVDPNEQTQPQEEVTGSSEEGLTKGPVVPIDPPTKVDPNTTPDTPEAVARTNAPVYQAMASGDGWRMVNVSGVLMDPDTDAPVAANEPVYVVDSIDKIDGTPLSASTKASIKGKFANLTGEARQGAIFVRKVTEDKIAAQPKTTSGTGTTYFLGCDDVDKSFTKSFHGDKHFSWSQNTDPGKFTGSISVSGGASATVTAKVTLTLNQFPFITGCETYWGHLKSANLTGYASAAADGKANGSFSASYSKSVTIAEPKIYDDWISVGGIPLWIKVTLPVEAGVDASAKVDATVDAHMTANANFAVDCQGTDNCSTTKSASFSFHPNTDAHLGLNVRAKVTPFAKVGLKIALYDTAATAKVSVKAGLVSDFWGYYGNTCGDANADGVPEYVSAATLDESIALDVIGEIKLFGSSVASHTWNIGNYHLAFWDLLSHSTALDPIVTPKYGSQTVNMRMRPCYPYANPVNYQVDWMDGTALTPVTSAAAQTNAQASHAYASAGPRIAYTHAVTVKAVTDNAPRTINGSTVGKYDSTPILMQ